MKSVLSRWVILGALLTTSVVATSAELEMQTGEIRLDGTVHSVNSRAKLLVMDALSFSLPNGKGNRFPAPKAKNIDVSASTLLHVRGDEKRVLSLRDVKAGAFVVVLGADKGSGKNLPAREIIV